MPNTYEKTPARMTLALARLLQRANFTNLITRTNGDRFTYALNDEVTYELGGITIARDYEWRTRNAPIVYDEISRTTAHIKLDTHTYSGNRFTDEEERLDLESYGTQILFPQVDALATKLDGKVTNKLLNATPAVTTLQLGPAVDDTLGGPTTGTDVPGETALRQMLHVKAMVDAAGMPAGSRYLLAGAETFVWLAGSQALQKYDTAQATTAFRQGVVGRIAGFDIVDGTAVVDDDDFVALHPSWGVLANVAPSVPQGVTWGVRRTYQGWSLRAIRDYDANYLSDRSVVSTFTGISEIKDQYVRHTAETAAAANDGSIAGDPVVVDGEIQLTGNNARIATGSFVS